MADVLEEGEEGSKLVFQRGKKLNGDYFIVSVYDNAEKTCVSCEAYELETSETISLSLSYSELDGYFRNLPDLQNASNKEARFDWIVERLDFSQPTGTEPRKLVVGGEPTLEDVDAGAEKAPSGKKAPKAATARMTYAERQALEKQNKQLEEKRAQAVAQKSENARRAFLAELQEKKRLEELKAAARRQRIEEERAERRETDEMSKRMRDEKMKRYEENDKKRALKLKTLMSERAERDKAKIRAIIDDSEKGKAERQAAMDAAKKRRREEDEIQREEDRKKKDEQAKLEAVREEKIRLRTERIQSAEKSYLRERQQAIAQLAEQRRIAEEKKIHYLQDRAAIRAQKLRERHEAAEKAERLEDHRTQENLKREHSRNQMMLNHIEELRTKKHEDDLQAQQRKEAALEQRKEKEKEEAEQQAAKQQRIKELQEKREDKIKDREGRLKSKNQDYVTKIRDLKTQEDIRKRGKQEALEEIRLANREAKLEQRRVQQEQEEAAGEIAKIREQNIRKAEQERDKKYAAELQEQREHVQQAKLRNESRKHETRLAEKENAQKKQEELVRKREMQQQLESLRNENIQKRTVDRNAREQTRVNDIKGDADKVAETPN